MEKEYYKSLHGENPADYNGKNASCLLCDKEAENLNEHCEDHQNCVMCNANNDCECKDEWSEVSSCCEARMETDLKRCYECKDSCSSVWDEANE